MKRAAIVTLVAVRVLDFDQLVAEREGRKMTAVEALREDVIDNPLEFIDAGDAMLEVHIQLMEVQ